MQANWLQVALYLKIHHIVISDGLFNKVEYHIFKLYNYKYYFY